MTTINEILLKQPFEIVSYYQRCYTIQLVRIFLVNLRKPKKDEITYAAQSSYSTFQTLYKTSTRPPPSQPSKSSQPSPSRLFPHPSLSPDSASSSSQSQTANSKTQTQAQQSPTQPRSSSARTRRLSFLADASSQRT
jgi:hypothetical protein